jgi:hypothetical protein
VLLFGDYEWNRRISSPSDNRFEMVFKERERVEGREFWKKDRLELPAGLALCRVRNWEEVVEWVKNVLCTPK